MKTQLSISKFILSGILILVLSGAKAFAQIGTEFFPQAGQTTEWTVNANNELSFIGGMPQGSPAIIATTFGGLVANDYTGLKLTFDAFVSAGGANTTVVLSSNGSWGGEGVVLEINEYQIQSIRNFDYANHATRLSSDVANYQNNIVKKGAYNSFIIDVSAGGVITMTVNGSVLPTSSENETALLTAPSPTPRYTYISTGFSGFKLKNLKAEKGTTTKNFFDVVELPVYPATFIALADQEANWTVTAANELSFVGPQPATSPAIVATTFDDMLANDYTGLKLTFDAFVSATASENTTLVLSSNGTWASKGIVLTINKDDIFGSKNYAAGTSLNSDAAIYKTKVNAGAYNSFIINVSTLGEISVTINGFACGAPYGADAGVLTAAAPVPRYAFFATGFSGFKMKNLKVEKGAVSKEYFTVTTLPVTLISFNATKKANGSQLNWETASEQNNSRFIISRSTDGINFTEIAKVSAKNQASKYQYIDNSPVSGNNYYQLKQVDFDGQSEVLGVKAVNFGLATSNTVSIYPKPATDKVNLSFSEALSGVITVKIFNLSGNEVQSSTIQQNGSTNYVLELNSNITAGMYVISVSSGKIQHSEKLMVK